MAALPQRTVGMPSSAEYTATRRAPFPLSSHGDFLPETFWSTLSAPAISGFPSISGPHAW